MPTSSVPIVLPDLLENIHESHGADWEPFRPGVTARWLYREKHGGASAVLLRFEPGARVPEHEHVGYEHQFVLEGDQFDEGGLYLAGSFVIHRPGTRHSPCSVSGCVVLLIQGSAVRYETHDGPGLHRIAQAMLGKY